MRIVVALAVFLAACVSDPPPGRTLTFVVSTIDGAADGSDAHGFDLDGRVGGDPSRPCTGAADFTSIETGETGVDNQLSASTIDALLAPDGLNGASRARIQSGASLIVIELSGVDDLTDDPSIGVRVRGAIARDAIVLDGDGIAPDQALVDSHVLDATNVGTGAIVHGRFEVRVPELLITFDAMHRPVPLRLHDVRIAGLVGTGGVEAGAIGGAVVPNDLVAPCDGPQCELGISPEIVFAPDLAPIASGVIDDQPAGTHCASFSAGFGFTAVRATLE